MTDLPKSVAELREEAVGNGFLLTVSGKAALDTLCALAAPNAKLREAAQALVLACNGLYNEGPSHPWTRKVEAERAKLVTALSVAPEAAKADEVAELRERTQAAEEALGQITEALKAPGWVVPRDVVVRVRGLLAQHEQHRCMSQKHVDNLGADIDELRAKLEAAEKRLAQENNEWADQIAAALCSTADKCGRTPSMLAGHVQREHEAHTRKFNQFIKVRDELEVAQRDLTAARADQRAVAVEELQSLRAKIDRWRDAVEQLTPKAGNRLDAIVDMLASIDKRIAALTAPAAEPAKPDPWFEPNDHTKNICAIRRKSDGYWWECNSEHGAGWNDKRIRQAWTIRAARIEVEKHLHGQDVEIVQLMPEPVPNPSETPNSSPTFDLAAEMAHDIRVAGLTPAQGGDGDAVLREWLSLNKAATPSSEWVDAMAAVVDALSRRALEGK